MSARRFPLLFAAFALLLTASSAEAAGKKYALLVGVREYDHADFAELRYTENDAEELAKVLKGAGYDEVVVLTTSRGKKDDALRPTAKNIRTQLKKLSDMVKRDDLLLIGLAGHGIQWPVKDTKTEKTRDESFFCPSDARPRSDETLAELKKTMIPLGELFTKLDESGAGVRLMLVDACRNEVKGTKRNVDIDNLPRTKKGTAVLFSCKGGEIAHETAKLGHGVFFHHVIQALKGEAKNDKGEVTWSRLVDHVIDKVSEDVPAIIGGGAKQTPHEIRNIEGRSPLLLRAAAKPDAEAEKLYAQGLDALYGLKDLIDLEKAYELFGKAAKRGHVMAAGRVGLMLLEGTGVAKDEAEGLRKLKAVMPAVRKAAEGGDGDAENFLAERLASGQGVGKDDKEAVRLFKRSAARGDVSGMINLGMRYANGPGIEKDEKAAVKWFHKAEKKGSPGAMAALGWMYLLGRGVDKDVKAGTEWWVKAAEKGEVPTMSLLGRRYLASPFSAFAGLERDEKEAAKWFRKAAEKGDLGAMVALGGGDLFLYWSGVEGKEGVDWLRKAIDRKYSPAMTALARKYQAGAGVERDEKEAVRWYIKAGELGDGSAIYLLGRIFGRGECGEQVNPKEAFKWYLKGAEQGGIFGILDVANCYLTGWGTEKNGKEAIKWYKKAAEISLLTTYKVEALNWVGAIYRDGLAGVKKDHKEASRWFRQSADLGDAFGIAELGRLYARGEHGIGKDLKEAIRLYRKAIEKGDAPAMRFLGDLYAEGEGVEKNLDEALSWYKKAVEKGDEKAVQKVKDLEKK